MEIKLTFDQFIHQWVPSNPRNISPMPRRLESRLYNFTTAAGEYALSSFKGSFDKGGFCGRSAWAPRASRWGKRFTHPVMLDSGRLKDGIKGEMKTRQRGEWKWPIDGKGRYGGGKDFKLTYGYNIKTTEISFPENGEDKKKKKKRGKTNRSKYNYAAVHNTAPGISPFKVNQYSDRKPVQRQFIGHDAGVLSHINSEFLKVFDNLFLNSNA